MAQILANEQEVLEASRRFKYVSQLLKDRL